MYTNENLKDLLDELPIHISKVNQLYASLQNPLRRRLDFDSIIRRLLVVDPLPPTAKPIYDLEKGKILVQTTTHHFHTQIDVNEYTMQQRLDKLFVKTYKQMCEYEDLILAELLEKCITNLATPKNVPVTMPSYIEHPWPVAVRKISETYWGKPRPPKKEREPNDSEAPCKIIVNSKDYQKTTEILSQIATDTKRIDELNYYDPTRSTVFGWELKTNKFIPEGRIYGVPDPEYLGVIPIRKDIVVTNIDEIFSSLDSYFIAGYGILAPQNVFAIDFT